MGTVGRIFIGTMEKNMGTNINITNSMGELLIMVHFFGTMGTHMNPTL